MPERTLERLPEHRLRHRRRGRGVALRAARPARAAARPVDDVAGLAFRRDGRRDGQPARAVHRRPRRAADAGLGPAAGLPAPLPAVAVQLSAHPGGDADHLARLSVHLLVLRPLDLRPQGAPAQRRVRRAACAASWSSAASATSSSSTTCSRCASSGSSTSATRFLDAGFDLHLELQQPSQSARPADPAADAARRLLADRLRHRVGLAARARRRQARGAHPAHARDAAHDARRRHPHQGLPDARPSDRGAREPRRRPRPSCASSSSTSARSPSSRPIPARRPIRPSSEHGAFDEDWERMNAMKFVFVPNGLERGRARDATSTAATAPSTRGPTCCGAWRA